jgi:hypothetical protein
MYDKPTTRHLFFHKKANFFCDFFEGMQEYFHRCSGSIILAKNLFLINVLGLFGLFHFFFEKWRLDFFGFDTNPTAVQKWSMVLN